MEDGVVFSERMLSEIRWLEAVYGKPQGHPWRDEDELYRLYYRDNLTEEEKDEFFKVPVRDLDYFCSKFCGKNDPTWSRNMLADAVMFFKLHNTWKVYICPYPECLCWFSDDDSLVLHLINEHCNAWPFLQQNLSEDQWCAKALCSTVWEPIDARAALNTLSTTSLDGISAERLLDVDPLASLEWPLSEDFRRRELLAKLQRSLELLLDSQESDCCTLRCNGFLRALIAVATDEILRRFDPMNILPLPFRALFYCSPLSFRFMEEKSLCHFVEIVEGICNLSQASQNREFEGSKDNDVDWTKGEYLGAVSFSADHDCFVLDSTKLRLCGVDEKDMGLWMFEAPIFPTVEKLPAKASDILQLAESKAVSFSECLTTICAQSDLKLAALASCFRMWNMGHWPMPLLDTLSPKLALNSESNTANVKDMQSSSCHSIREPAKRHKSDFDSQHYLELVKLTGELQFFELQVRRLCAVDLRMYIFPLLRSFLRMALYMFIRIGLTEDVEEEDADEGHIIEGLREENPEEHVHSKENIKEHVHCKENPKEHVHRREPAAEDDSHVMMPDMSSQWSAVAESEAKPETIPESDAKPESQWSREVQFPVCCHFDMYSDSDSQSEPESSDGDSDMKEFSEMEEFSTVVWLMRGKCAWETKENGLFVCIMINDVMKDCLKKFGLHTAQNIWGWKTNRSRKYWCCFDCDKRFPDQTSHMLHMESAHYLGVSWDHDWLVPSQVQQEGQSEANEGVKKRTHNLDDSVAVDYSYRTFIVNMENFGILYQNEEEGGVQNGNLFAEIVCHIQQQLRCLVDLFDTKSKLCSTFEIGGLDAEIVQTFAQLKTLKQNLSNLCVSDCKNEILPSICSFLQKQHLMDSGFRSWALQRLNDLLCSISCPCLPDSFSIKLVSPGKVIINIDEYSGGITFAFVGLRWEFAGDLSIKGSRKVKGIFMFSGASDKHDVILHDWKIVLDREIKMTKKMSYFRARLARHLTTDLLDKLPQFQAEFRGRLKG